MKCVCQFHNYRLKPFVSYYRQYIFSLQRCQCTGVGSEWQLDYGTFTNNTLLPVRAVFAGDIGNKYPTKKEGIKYQVSDLLCQQSSMGG